MGELFALSAAALWTVSAFLFRAAGKQLSPVALNSTKGGLAIVVLGGWILGDWILGDWILGDWSLGSGSSAWTALSQSHLIWLLISGVVGIGIGDTAFFFALNRLGEQRAVLIAETLAPPITVSFALLWMGERLTVSGYFGIALTLMGVVLGVTSRATAATIPEAPSYAADNSGRKISEHARFSGGSMIVAVMCAITAASCQAFGAVISRWVLAGNPLSPIESSLIRMLGGQAMLFCLLAPRALHFANSKDTDSNDSVSNGTVFKNTATSATQATSGTATSKRRSLTTRGLVMIVTATLLGTVLGIVLQQASLKYTSAGISQTLIATSVLWVLPIAWLAGHRPTPRGILAATLGLAGVAVLCLV